MVRSLSSVSSNVFLCCFWYLYLCLCIVFVYSNTQVSLEVTENVTEVKFISVPDLRVF